MMNTRLAHSLILPVIIVALTACQAEAPTAIVPTMPVIPSITPTSLFGVPMDPVVVPTQPLAITTSPATMTPAITPPALVLPDAKGVSVACASNTLRVLLVDPAGGAFGAVSRILSSGDWLYLLIDGGLYRLDRLGLVAGQPMSLERLMLPGDIVAGRPVQELTDIDADPGTGWIYLLDKVGHIFRFDETEGASTLTYRAAPDPNEELDDPSYQFVALTVDGQGRVIVLDSSRGALWTPANAGMMIGINRGSGLTGSSDVTSAGDQYYVLQRNGSLRTITSQDGSKPWRDADGRRLGLALKTSDHLGSPLVFSVDGLRREIIAMLPGGSVVARYVFAFPDIGLLRDAVFADGRLMAIADDQLLIYPGPMSPAAAESCSPLNADGYMRPQLYGADILGTLVGITSPIDGVQMTSYTRLYPGASRLYRLGVHQGIDFFGYRRGWPVVVMADGVVVRASLSYDDVSAEDFDRMVAESEMLGKTPAEYLERLEGKQVLIDHGNGILSFYAHLDEIAAGIVPGATVQAGQPLGTVGVSGTMAESQPGTVGSHLHFEIRIGQRYLGQGISIREASWWLSEVFANQKK